MAIKFVEDIIAALNPGAAIKRAQLHAALGMYRQHMSVKERHYEAAEMGRRTNAWDAARTSANAEIWMSLPTLRNRSRELQRNNPYAKRAIDVIANNVVGSGIRPKINDESVKALWEKWANTTKCDFDAHLNFYGLQHKVMESVARDGECIILPRRKGAGFPLQLQVLEADYIDHYRNLAQMEQSDMGWIFNGIQFDKRGKLIGYWLWDRHPGEAIRMGLQSKFYPAKDVIHVFRAERPGQHRGVPMGTSVFNTLRDLDFFIDAERQKQSAAACFSVIIQNPDIENIPGSAGADITPMTERLEPGLIQETKPGQTVSVVNPPVFNAYAEYVKSNLYAVSSGYGIPYHALTSDLEHASFSSMKAGDRQYEQVLLILQEHLMVPKMCQPCFEWFVNYARQFGLITEQDDVTAVWTNPRRAMIDPAKETKAKIEALQAGLISYPEAWREDGYDPEEVMQEIAEVNKRLDELGIKLSGDFRQEILADMKPTENAAQAVKKQIDIDVLRDLIDKLG
jgi:lambda family phage portal protein